MKISDAVTGFWLTNRLNMSKATQAKYAHAHRFRYTFAIEFLRNGGNVFVLKELLGHEKLEQTMRYVKFVESDISESAKHSPTDNWRL